MLKKFLVSMAFLLTLCSCASQQDVQIVQSDNAVVASHGVQQSADVEKKTAAIENIFGTIARTYGGKDTAESGAVLALSGAMASRDIAAIKTEKYEGPVHKTSLDVQYRGVEAAEKGLPIATVGFVADRAVEKGHGDTTTNTANGGSVSTRSDTSVAVSQKGPATVQSAPGPGGGTIEGSGHNKDDHSQVAPQ